MATRVPVVRVAGKHSPLSPGDTVATVRAYRQVAGATAVTTDDSVVVLTGTTAVTFTLPAATAVPLGFVLSLINHSSATLTSSQAWRTSTTATTTTLNAGAAVTIISDGTQYRRVQ